MFSLLLRIKEGVSEEYPACSNPPSPPEGGHIEQAAAGGNDNLSVVKQVLFLI